MKKAAEVCFPAPPHLLTIPDLTVGCQCVEKINNFHLQIEQTGVLAVLKALGTWAGVNLFYRVLVGMQREKSRLQIPHFYFVVLKSS